MKAKTVWKNWWVSDEGEECNSRWGYDGQNSKLKSVVFGLHADVRWVNVIDMNCDATDLDSDGKIIGDE